MANLARPFEPAWPAAPAAHRRGMLAVVAAALLWSTGGLAIKWVSLDALGITMWRSLFAAATIAALTGTAPPLPWRASRLTWALAVSYALMLVFFVSATRLTTAANAIFLQYTAPLYVLVLGPVFIAEQPSRSDAACVAVAFAGMALFFVGRLEPSDTAGNACALVSGLSFAVFLVLLRAPSCTGRDRLRAIILGNILLVVVLGAVNATRGWPDLFVPEAPDFAALVFLGVFQIGVAYVLFTRGIARIPALEASLFGMLEPVLNPVWGFLVLGEKPGWWAVAGGEVIIAAVGVRTVFAEATRTRLLAPALPGP